MKKPTKNAPMIFPKIAIPQNFMAPKASSSALQFNREAGSTTFVSEKRCAPVRITIKKPTEKPKPCSKRFRPVDSIPAEIRTEKRAPKVIKDPAIMDKTSALEKVNPCKFCQVSRLISPTTL